MDEGEMRAGAARVAIDLGDVLPFDGFDELRHEVFARALIIEGTGRRACVLSLEVTSIAPALLADLREIVEDAANCSGAYSWVVPTHTFSMPHVRTPGHLADDATRNRNERYRAALVAAARTAVERAVAGIRSVTLATVEGECPVNVNRDIETPAGWWLGSNPRGFADHTMPVLAIRDAGGEYVACSRRRTFSPPCSTGRATPRGGAWRAETSLVLPPCHSSASWAALPCCCQAPRATKVRRSAP